jgi:ferric-dicitrate binding protein FerR (iron transport regulator)
MMTVKLEDNSVVELSPASSLQFDVPFPADKRNIILDGEAKFQVTKNKKKPFTVYAGVLATTALGTIFSVKKNEGKNSVIVKLYEGKVVIHSTNKNLKGWKDDVYLLPGNQMKFDALLNTVAVNNIVSSKPNIAVKQVKPDKDSVSDQLTFNNTVLPVVMKKLSAYYKTNIQFEMSIIDTMNFTGIVSKKDSLPFILKAIAQMNNL